MPRMVPIVLPAAIALLCLAATPCRAGASAEPVYETLTVGDVIVRYDPGRRATAHEVAGFLPRSLARLTAELGLTTARGPVRIDLPPAGREPWPGGKVPDWVAGYALPRIGTVVLVWGREPRYPDSSVQTLLEHELAHVLVYRATLGRGLPRWFEEGAAMSLAREWAWSDSWHSSLGMVFLGEPGLDRLSVMFGQGGERARSAYALSHSFAVFLSGSYGPDFFRRIVTEVGNGGSFEAAFEAVTGRSVPEIEERWRQDARMRFRWVPVVTSTSTLWLLITGLTLIVFARKRRESRKLLEEWEMQEQEALPPDDDPPRYVM